MVVLQYTDGSPCGESKSSRSRNRTIRGTSTEMGHDDTYITDDDQDEAKIQPRAMTRKDEDVDHRRPRRKSTTLSFHCEPEHIGGAAGISFVAADPDDCAYFFEVRSQHACARAEPHQPGAVGPGSIFAIILGITVLVYFGGGIFYQRTVAHARGWRQIPNYTLWSGIWSFICVGFLFFFFFPLIALHTTNPCALRLGHVHYRHVVVWSTDFQTTRLPPYRRIAPPRSEQGRREPLDRPA